MLLAAASSLPHMRQESRTILLFVLIAGNSRNNAYNVKNLKS